MIHNQNLPNQTAKMMNEILYETNVKLPKEHDFIVQRKQTSSGRSQRKPSSANDKKQHSYYKKERRIELATGRKPIAYMTPEEYEKTKAKAEKLALSTQRKQDNRDRLQQRRMRLMEKRNTEEDAYPVSFEENELSPALGALNTFEVEESQWPYSSVYEYFDVKVAELEAEMTRIKLEIDMLYLYRLDIANAQIAGDRVRAVEKYLTAISIIKANWVKMI